MFIQYTFHGSSGGYGLAMFFLTLSIYYSLWNLKVKKNMHHTHIEDTLDDGRQRMFKKDVGYHPESGHEDNGVGSNVASDGGHCRPLAPARLPRVLSTHFH